MKSPLSGNPERFGFLRIDQAYCSVSTCLTGDFQSEDVDFTQLLSAASFLSSLERFSLTA
jgi:hypothetical protein